MFIDRVVHETEGGADKDAVPRGVEHVDRFPIREVAVIDAVDLVAHRALDRFRGTRMAGDTLAPVMRHFNRRRDFGFGHRHRLGPYVAREFIAGDVDFYVFDAFPDAEAARLAQPVGPVGDHAKTFGGDALATFVPEAARHGDFGAGGAISRPGQIAVFDLVLDHHVQPQLRGCRRVATRESVIEDL